MSAGPTREQSLLRVFVDLADTLTRDFDLPELLYRVAGHCTSLVAAAAAGVLLSSPQGGVSLVAASSERSEDVELLQLRVGSDPCLEAMAAGVSVRVPDLFAARARWPAWAPVALGAGFGSVYATPMTLHGDTVGVVTILAVSPGALSDDDLEVVRALTHIATIGILQQRALHQTELLADQLRAALNSRVVIEQAKGVISGRSALDVSTERAYLLLSDYAQRTSTTIGVVSQAVIDGLLDPAALVYPGRRVAARRPAGAESTR